jgi:hypothetical protein
MHREIAFYQHIQNYEKIGHFSSLTDRVVKYHNLCMAIGDEFNKDETLGCQGLKSITTGIFWFFAYFLITLPLKHSGSQYCHQ